MKSPRTVRLSRMLSSFKMDDAVELLETTLAEEKEADETLTNIAAELNFVAQELV